MHVAIKAPTFSFMRLRGVDPVLGVEMTSTGEVACIDYDFAGAFIKALMSAGLTIPTPEKPVLLTAKEEDHKNCIKIAEKLHQMGYPIFATEGTAKTLDFAGIRGVKVLRKIREGRGNILDYLAKGRIGLVINTPTASRRETVDDEYIIRRTASEFNVPVITRIETAEALVNALEQNGSTAIRVQSLNEFLTHSPWAKEV